MDKKYSIDDLERLINSIKTVRPELTDERIALAAGYNEGYISQCKSRGSTSGKFINALKKEFSKELEAKVLIVEDTNRFLTENAIKTTAYLRVVVMALAEILAHQKNESVTKVLSELQLAIEGEKTLHSKQ